MLGFKTAKQKEMERFIKEELDLKIFPEGLSERLTKSEKDHIEATAMAIKNKFIEMNDNIADRNRTKIYNKETIKKYYEILMIYVLGEMIIGKVEALAKKTEGHPKGQMELFLERFKAEYEKSEKVAKDIIKEIDEMISTAKSKKVKK